MVLGSVHSFTCSCPVFPAPFIEEAVFAPLYVLVNIELYFGENDTGQMPGAGRVI